MKHLLTGTAALMLTAAPVFAGAIERAPQSLGILFEEGNYVEFGVGRVSPELSGNDVGTGTSSGDIAKNYNFFGLGYKHQFNENLSGAIIVEQPFGADMYYPTTGSAMLGGTAVTIDSTTYTALLRYKFDNNIGIHGGIRGSHASGDVHLRGLGYGPVNGYSADLDGTWGWGYVLGASWEKPEIAARVSLTYNSPVTHDFDTTETFMGAPLRPGQTTTSVDTPRSWTLEGQTGVAADTLVFGSIRWVKWSEFKVAPDAFSCAPPAEMPPCFGVTDGLVTLENTTTYTLGVARKFTENWSGALSLGYEKSGNRLVSPLSPTTGRKSVGLAAIYTQDNWKVTTGITYIKLGDATADAAEPSAEFRDNDAWGVGVKVGYSF